MALSLSTVLPANVVSVDEMELQQGVQFFVLRDWHLSNTFAQDVPDKKERSRIKIVMNWLLSPTITTKIHTLHNQTMNTASPTYTIDVQNENKFVTSNQSIILNYITLRF